MRSLVFVALVSSLLGTSCTASAQPPDQAPSVMAAETFLADIAQHVAGDRFVVESLVAPGVDPHEFQLTPQDAIRLSKARLLIVNGLGYESWLQRSLSVADQVPLVEAAAGLTPGPQGDPHLWTDPRNVVRYVENIRDAFTQMDPAGAAAYAANADAYIRDLKALDLWIRSEVQQIPPDRRVLVTNHHALDAFARAYGFDIAGVVIPGATSEASPSAQQMASLIETIRSRNVPAIFLDVSENQKLARQIATESGAQVITGLYVETVSPPQGPAPTYLGMLKHDVALIVQGLK